MIHLDLPFKPFRIGVIVVRIERIFIEINPIQRGFRIVVQLQMSANKRVEQFYWIIFLQKASTITTVLKQKKFHVISEKLVSGYPLLP